tara:strand:+ start:58834 stop:59619 length:786 start_codon:yes stop_codon:yes gene_type:complete
MNNYISLRNEPREMSCFILGAGPSLYFNWRYPTYDNLNGKGLVFCVNSAVMSTKSCHYWISTDTLCMKWSWWKKMMEKNTHTIKVVRDSWLKYQDELKKYEFEGTTASEHFDGPDEGGFLYFKARPTPENIINPDDEGLSYCSSMAAAIDLAIQMGSDKIFVFGLDHCSFQGKDHFWQFWIKHNHPTAEPGAQWNWNKQQEVFPIHLQAYEALRGYAESRGSKIYNVNHREDGEWITKVDVFDKITLSEMKPMVHTGDEYF